MPKYPALNLALVLEALELAQADSMDALCLTCGLTFSGYEPDTRDQTCPGCGAPTLFGTEEVVIIGADLLP